MTLAEIEAPKIKIQVVEDTPTYGKFTIEPLDRGLGITLGNPLRRVLLSSLPGAAVTWIRVEGVYHEYSSIPAIKEDLSQFLLNVKAIRLRPLSNRSGKIRLEVSGEGRVCAGDVKTSADFEIVNPGLHLATLDSQEANLSVEFNVEIGKGYLQADQTNSLPIGVLPVDALFTPVRKVKYDVERTRVGQVTDYERLVLEVWTDGTTTSVEAVNKAGQILVEQFFHFTSFGKAERAGGELRPLALTIPAEQYNMPLEKLDLSSRSINALKRAGKSKVGEILEMGKADLLRIRNFGEKSLTELYGRLAQMGLLPPDQTSSKVEPPPQPTQEGEPPQAPVSAEQSA